MNSVGTARRPLGKRGTRGGTTLRTVTAMLLVALALPVGAVGAYAEEPAPADATTQAAETTSETTATGGTTEPAPGTGEPAEQPGADPAAGTTAPDPAAGTTAPDPGAASDPTTGQLQAAPSGTRELQQAAAPAAATLVAPPSATGGFEIDGDLPVNNGGTDWAATGSSVVDGAGDGSVYTTGDELQDPREWTDTSSSSAAGNDDIVRSYSHAEMVAGNLWVFFGFERAAASGTSNYVIEYNRLDNWSDNPAQPHRSPGDLRVRVTQGGSGAFTVAGVERWSVTAGSGCSAVTAQDKSTIGYWCPAPDATMYFTGDSSDDKFFAEGALNLTGLLGGGDNCLGGYGVVNMRSFAGGSQNSSLKDYVDPFDVNVPSTCGGLVINKLDQFGDPVPGATFTVDPNPLPGGTGVLTVTDGGAGDPDATADGVIRLEPARPRGYVVTETGVPAGYLPPGDATEDASVPANGTDEVTFVNRLTFEPLTVTNVSDATYDLRHDWVVRKSVDRTSARTAAGTPAEFDYTVTLEALEPRVVGREVGGTVTLSNPNDHAMVATVAVAGSGGAACAITGPDADLDQPGHQALVGAGAYLPVAYTCPVGGSGTPDGETTATITWDGATYPPVPGTAPDQPVVVPDGYAYRVDDVQDERATVTDVFDGGGSEDLGTFDVADVWASTDPAAHTVVVATYPRSVDGVAGECTDHDNTATATESDTGRTTTSSTSVEVCAGVELDVEKSVGVAYTRTYDWDLAKTGPATVFVGADGAGEATYDISVTAGTPVDSGVTVSGTITVSNDNAWPVTATVTDTFTLRGVETPCTISGGGQVEVPADGSVPLGYSCALAPSVWPDGYDGHNEVTVTWDQSLHPTTLPSTTYTNHVDEPEVSETPALDTVALADRIAEDGGAGVAVELPAELRELTWAEVRAADGHRVTFPVTVDLAPDLAAGGCTSYTNVVSIPGTAESADAGTEVCRPEVDKTVDASFGQTRLWTVEKTVDRDGAEIAEGGSATFGYTVTATPGRVVDDGTASWTGVVSVANPSETTELVVDVEDLADVAGWTCTFDGTDTASSSATVGAGDTAELAYTCAGAGHPGGDNTVTVDFGGEQESLTVPVAFTPRETVGDSTVEVRDDLTAAGTPAEVLFVADAADPSTWTHDYDLAHTGVAGECTSYRNTASIDLAGDDTADPTDSVTAEVCVEKPLELTTTASGTFARDYDWTLDKVADDPSASIPDGTTHRFPYTVTATPDGYVDSGWEAHGTITLTNPNAYADGGITATVSDRLSGITGADCAVADPDVVLAPGASVTLTYDCSLAPTAADYVGSNVATATWTPAPLHVPAQPAAPAAASASSDPVPVSLSLPAGNVTDFAVEVHDDPQGASGPDPLGTARWGAEPGTATAGDATTFTYDGPERAGVGGECTDYGNVASLEQGVGDDLTASASVELCVGLDLEVEKTVAVAYDRTYEWDLAKTGPATVFVGDDSTGEATYDLTVTAETPTDSGVTVTGSIAVTNPNDWGMVADVADTFTLRGVDTECTVAGGDDLLVPGGTTVDLGYTCELAAGDWPEGYDGSNEVTVSWDAEEYFTPTGSASHTNAVDPPEVTERPAFATVALADEIAEQGGTGVPVELPAELRELTWAEVRAAEGHRVTFPVTVDLAPDLAAGGCTSYTNVLAIPGTAESAEAGTEVCRPAIDKSVDASFGRAYRWSIDKVVDRTSVVVGPDGTATFGYTVTVAPDGYDDRGATLGGVITVANPSEVTDLVAGVADVVDVAGWTCRVDGTGEVTVPAGDSLPVAYTCDAPASGAHPDGSNTATATFGEARVSVTEEVDFEQVESIDATVAVTDPRAPGGVLGEVAWADGEQEFTYDWVSPVGEPGTCTAYDNTARIASTGQAASQSVEVCTQAPAALATDVAAAVDRDHAWSIDKVADPDVVRLADGEEAVIDYTVTVTPGEQTLSGWTLAGTTTVTNPNDFTDLTVSLEQVADVGEQVVCEYADGPELTVGPLDTGTAAFTCQLDQAAYDDGTATTTGSWIEAPAGSTSVTTPVAFDLRSDTGGTVTVHDDLTDPDGDGQVLGTVEWDAEGIPTEFVYSLTVDQPAGAECQALTNTAQIVETEQAADATVDVCPIEDAPVETSGPNPGGKGGVAGVEVKGVEAQAGGLPDTGAPAGLAQLGLLALLSTAAGLLLLWQSRRLRS